MRTFNPNKKIKIEICAPENPADSYTIWDVTRQLHHHVITRRADENDIEDILGMHDFNAFETAGKFVFQVEAGKLTDKFQYLYS